MIKEINMSVEMLQLASDSDRDVIRNLSDYICALQKGATIVEQKAMVHRVPDIENPDSIDVTFQFPFSESDVEVLPLSEKWKKGINRVTHAFGSAVGNITGWSK